MSWLSRRRAALPGAMLAAFLVSAGPALAEPRIERAEWSYRPLAFSKQASITNNFLSLGPADSELEPKSDRVFALVTLHTSIADDGTRTDRVQTAVIQDGSGKKHELAAVYHDDAWRPAAFIDRGFRMLRVPEPALLLFDLPREAPRPYTLLLGKQRLDGLDAAAGSIPKPPPTPPAEELYCLFEGYKLRPEPSPSAEGEVTVPAGARVTRTRERKGLIYVKTERGEGWAHPLAFTKDRAFCTRAAQAAVKPASLLLAANFRDASDFTLEIWHGGVELPGGDASGGIRLKPGDCIAVSAASPGSYRGPYQVFGHPIPAGRAGALYMVGADNKLAPLAPGPGLPWMAGAGLAALAGGVGLGLLCRSVLRRRSGA